MQEIGAVLRAIRKDAGYSQERLGEALGFGRVYISRVETGSLRPSWRCLTAYANLFRIPVTGLLQAAGLVSESHLDAQEFAALAAVYPDLLALFERGRTCRRLLQDLARAARMLLLELESEAAAESNGAAAPTYTSPFE